MSSFFKREWLPYSAIGRFFRRRWFLLLLTLVLFACSMVNFSFFLKTSANVWFAGTVDGSIGVQVNQSQYVPDDYVPTDYSGEKLSIHRPILDGEASFHWEPDAKWMAIPTWFLLAAVLGWIVFRELRWRERRGDAGGDAGNREE